MPYTMKVEGMAKLEKLLEDLGEKAIDAASEGLYDGAAAMADEIRHNVDSIKTEPFRYIPAGSNEKRLPSPEEKTLLKRAGAGIAKFKKDEDGVGTSVGYSRRGYGQMVGRMKPIPQVANAINSGTSFMQKQAFFRRAVSRGSRDAETAIIRTMEERLDAIIKENGGNNT